MVDDSEIEITVLERGVTDSTDSEDVCSSETVKTQQMTFWNKNDKIWKDVIVTYTPPLLTVTEYYEIKLEVIEKQLKHLDESWFHGDISRREAKQLLLDYKGRHCSFLVRESQTRKGMFAVSFLFCQLVRHAMIECKPHPQSRLLYSMTPNGPFFPSLYDLVETGREKCLLYNEHFGVILRRFPTKFDRSWLDKSFKSHREAEECFVSENRNGSFSVYRLQEDSTAYSITYRAEDRMFHTQILPHRQGNVDGYILNNIFSNVVYKIIHYFMENPFHGQTVLKYPVGHIMEAASRPVCGLAIEKSLPPDLEFPEGALIRNIHQDDSSPEKSVGDFGELKQKSFKSKCVRILNREEIPYLSKDNFEDDSPMDTNSPDTSTTTTLADTPTTSAEQTTPTDSAPSDTTVEPTHTQPSHTHKDSSLTIQLNLLTDYKVTGCDDCNDPCVIVLKSVKDSPEVESYELRCPSLEDREEWVQSLPENYVREYTRENALQLTQQTADISKTNKHGCQIS